MTSLKTSIKTITYLSDIGCLEIQGASLEPVWIGWNEQTAGLASGWWRDEILANSAIAGVYAKSDDGKSAI